jgi:hypothetical protein
MRVAIGRAIDLDAAQAVLAAREERFKAMASVVYKQVNPNVLERKAKNSASAV